MAAPLSEAAWRAYHKARGTTPKLTYAQYVAAHTKTAPTIVTPPGPVPGTLDTQGTAEMADLDKWKTSEDADIQASLDAAGLDYNEGTQLNETQRAENVRRNTVGFGARGLLRSGLRAGGEAKVESGHLDVLRGLNRRWSSAQDAARRARQRLADTYGSRSGDVSRNAWNRLIAEWQNNGGSYVSKPAPAKTNPTPSPVAPKATPPKPRTLVGKRPPKRTPVRSSSSKLVRW